MKKILSLVLVLSLLALSAFTLASCKTTPVEKEYKLAIAVDDGLGTIGRNKVTNIALALVIDADGKVAAARFDSIEQSLKVTDGAITPVNRLTTKVENGDSYGGGTAENPAMPAGSWANQAKAFEDFIVGKTAAEVAALDTSNVSGENPIVAGCTMSSSTPVFQSLVAKAFAYERKVSFKTADTITLGFGIEARFTGSVADGAKVSAAYAAVVVAGGNVVASMLDEAECSYEFTENEGAYTAAVKLSYGKGYAGSKNDQGDAYDAYSPMEGGRWYAQAQAYANSTVGKTVADLANLASEGVAGCTIGVANYKLALIVAGNNVR